MSLYAAAHADPRGPGDARPTALQIVKDNELEGKLAGKVAVVRRFLRYKGRDSSRFDGDRAQSLCNRPRYPESTSSTEW